MALWLAVAGVLGALAVAIGAYAAHGFEGTDAAKAWLDTGLRYHAWHALALLALGLGAPAAEMPRWLLHAGGGLFLVGTLLFSGALYMLAIAGRSPFAMAAPLGGSLLVAGWLALAVAGLFALLHPGTPG